MEERMINVVKNWVVNIMPAVNRLSHGTIKKKYMNCIRVAI